MIAGSSSIFLKCICNKSCSAWAALLKFWIQTDLGSENSTGFYMQGRQSLLTLITLYVQFSSSDWSKFDRWVHAKNLCSVWNLLTDSWSWQGFVSPCGVFNCLFLLDVPSEIELLTRLFCVIHGWFVYCAFGWEMHRLSKSLEIRFRMASFSKMSFLTCPCLRHKQRVEKSQAVLAWLDDLQEQHLDW